MKRMTRDEITDVLKRGARAHGHLCTYVWRPGTHTSISVVVSKKVGRTAVLRNRVKRRVRAAVRTAPIGARSIVIIAKSTALAASVSEFAEEFCERMNRTV